MPGLTGEQLIQKVRQSGHCNEETPILFVSGYHNNLGLEGSLHQWEDVYFVDKPDVEGKLNRLATLLFAKAHNAFQE